MRVRHQSERPATLVGRVVEHDRPRLRDPDRGGRDHAVDRVQFGPGQRRVVVVDGDARRLDGLPPGLLHP
ncbi:hypothetical protein SDC9_208352 [bioreactor metagenome]|uniref:Uncharacterized protein n=1 Tax=bioreactor metagenome TaxID=1076179 RepID=A0A645JLV7_9ZZZZ